MNRCGDIDRVRNAKIARVKSKGAVERLQSRFDVVKAETF